MDKNAQKRGLLDTIKEKSNISGIAAEKFFKPEQKRVMTLLNSTDDAIRAILTGEKIGTSAAPQDKAAVKDLLKSAKTNFNRREYLSAVSDLGRFHKKMFDVNKLIQGLNLGVDRIHHDFLFQGLDNSQKQQLNQLREHMGASSFGSKYFIKEAGIMDFFYNIGTKRGRALAAWEKRYPNVVKKIKDGLQASLDQAESLLSDTLLALKDMAAARASQSPDEYVESAKKISNSFMKFDNGKNGFKTYYNDVIKPYLEKQDQYEKDMQPETISPQSTHTPLQTSVQAPQELANQEVVDTEKDEVLPFSPTVPAQVSSPQQFSLTYPKPPTNLSVPSSAAPIPLVNKAPEKITQTPGTEKEEFPAGQKTMPSPGNEPSPEFKSDQLAQQMWGVSAKHKNFINNLEALGNENPLVLAGFISKYAKSIQGDEPEVAIQLLKLVKNLRK